jgi:hypothetical protein
MEPAARGTGLAGEGPPQALPGKQAHGFAFCNGFFPVLFSAATAPRPLALGTLPLTLPACRNLSGLEDWEVLGDVTVGQLREVLAKVLDEKLAPITVQLEQLSSQLGGMNSQWSSQVGGLSSQVDQVSSQLDELISQLESLNRVLGRRPGSQTWVSESDTDVD